MDFSNKKVLVTGGAIRVGAEIVKSFDSQGATVFIHYNTSHNEACELKSQLSNAVLIQANLDQPNDVERLAKLIIDENIDVLVNNASIYEHFNLADESTETMRKHLQINYYAPKKLMESIAKNLTSTNEDEKVIINILDQILLSAHAPAGSYYESRKKLLLLTLEFAKSLGNKNLRVNGVAPGPVLAPTILVDKSMSKTIPTLPLKRKVKMEDLIDTINFLCTNSSITGAIIPVDCGQHLI